MIKIIGAGLAGLLAARLLRHRNPVIYEAAPSLPNNHSAVLRFRSPLVGEVLGIPFRKVRVLKASLPWRNPVADALAYSNKNLGTYRSDRSMPATAEVVDRWIAPPDLVERMAAGLDIRYGEPFDFASEESKVISTIPMPILMSALEYEPHVLGSFRSVDGINVRCRIDHCDAYVSLAVPDPGVFFSRLSITGDELIAECPGVAPTANIDIGYLVRDAGKLLGIDRNRLSVAEVTAQRYAKIAPVDEHVRRNFIFWASSVTGRAFSLGRFATWRPGLLLDDLVQDVRMIDGWIASGTPGYDMDIHAARRKP